MSLFNKLSDTAIFERPTLRIFLYCLAAISVFLPNYIYYSKVPLLDSVSEGEKNSEEEAKNHIYVLTGMAQTHQEYYRKPLNLIKNLADIRSNIEPETQNYSYRIVQPMVPSFDWKQPQTSANWVMTIAQAKDGEYGVKIKTYLGYVYTTTISLKSGTEEVVTKTIICEQKKLMPKVLFSWQPSAMPAMINGQMECPPNYQKLED